MTLSYMIKWNKKQVTFTKNKFFVKNGEISVADVEFIFPLFSLEDNITLPVSDTAGSLLGAMFPGSKIAHKYVCTIKIPQY